GGITENDVMLASASDAVVLGFNVSPDAKARAAADRENVDVRSYRIIYEMIDEVKKAMEGLLAPEEKEVWLGRADVKEAFKITKVGTIAGCQVSSGKIQRNARVRLIRDGAIVVEGKISSLKRFKDDAREVAEGMECGIGIENFNDVKQGDVIEAFIIEKKAATL
ncbi:MAG TPA: EF-Tu/IF-2/RF-3 family GTPase, partial [bacterium]|nr:EF-Tu/IF-2/RF-3 family GTPase [bacterium]